MTFIPNVRDIHKFKVKENTPDELNPYHESLMDDDDKTYVDGYDHCALMVENAFFNIDTYRDDFEEAGFNVDNIDISIIEAEKAISDYSKEELEAMTFETKIVLAMATVLIQSLELDRNELVTSCIDNMNQEEYDRNYKIFEEDVKNGKYND